MLFTIGHEDNYSAAIAGSAPEPITKTGRNPDYPGGIVFETVREALNYLVEFDLMVTYTVWGLDTTLENTYENAEGELHLIEDAPIVDIRVGKYAFRYE